MTGRVERRPASVRRVVLALAAAALLGAPASAQVEAVAPTGRADPPRTHVVLLMADDMGWGDLGFHTPNLDAMVANGLHLRRFYAASPVCSPTRGSVLTGRHGYRYGVTHANVGRLPEREITLTEVLAEAGYATGHFGKWHLGTLTTEVDDSNRGSPGNTDDFSPPWQHGFETCFSTEAKVPTRDPMVDPKTGEPYGTAYWDATGARVTESLEGDDSTVIMDRVLPFVRGAVEDERPFFAVVWFHAPHLPVVASAEDRAPFVAFEERLQHYWGSVAAMDRQVGRLRDELARLGVADDTLLWFCSDNGPEGSVERPWGTTGGLRGRKRSLYEGGVRVPGVVEWPARIAPGSVSDTPAVTSDILPTICRALGLLPDTRDTLVVPERDGVALELTDSRGDPRPLHTRRPPIAFESVNAAALLDGDFKLVASLGPADASAAVAGERPIVDLQLFDLSSDPEELEDLSDRGGERLELMVEHLRHWQRMRDAPAGPSSSAIPPAPRWPFRGGLGSPPPRDGAERGTQFCQGCQTRREVSVGPDGLEVGSIDEPEVARWIAERLPQHEHVWLRVGCWFGDEVISCSVTVPLENLAPEDWHAYLRSPTGLDLAAEVAAASTEADRVERRVRDWLVTHAGR